MNDKLKQIRAIYAALLIYTFLGFLLSFYSRFETTHEKMEEAAINNVNYDVMIMQTITVDFSELAFRNQSFFESMYNGLEKSYQILDEANINELLKQLDIEDTSSLSFEEKKELVIISSLEKTTSAHLEEVQAGYQVDDTENLKVTDVFYIGLDEFKNANKILGANEASTHFVKYIDENNTVPLYSIIESKQLVEMYVTQDSNTTYILSNTGLYVGEELYGKVAYTIELDLGATLVVGNGKMIYSKPINKKVDEDEDAMIAQLLETHSVEEVSEKLSDMGYLSFYNEDNEVVSVFHYAHRSDFDYLVLLETISVFEFELFIMALVILGITYFAYAPIIRPSYLLIEYVNKCSLGQYEIPSVLLPEWRKIFTTVRDAYLENERLLTIKENQSQEIEFAWKKAMIANQAKNHFLAKVSHELRTPLNAIKGYAQLLRISTTDPKKLRQIDIIDSSSNLLLGVVKELLDFSKIEEGKIQINITAVEMRLIGEMIHSMFVNQTEEKNVKFLVNVDPRIPKYVYGDENKLKQIIINLVGNAVKFTNIGTIRVLIYLDRLDENYAYIGYKVEDTGKGISSEKLSSIFEPFLQENDSISRKFGGTGLGLSISKGFVEAMNGTIEVESEKFIGSVFKVVIPLDLNKPKEDQCEEM